MYCFSAQGRLLLGWLCHLLSWLFWSTKYTILYLPPGFPFSSKSLLLKSVQLLPTMFSCVYGVHIYIYVLSEHEYRYMRVGACAPCTCAHGVLTLIWESFSSDPPSTLFTEASPLNQTQSLLMWLVSLVSLFWGVLYFLSPRLELYVWFHTLSVFTWFLGPWLQSSRLCGEYHNHWAMSAALHFRFSHFCFILSGLS